MKRTVLVSLMVLGVLLTSGCVKITQEVHINHDGSGKIVERVTVLPRGIRLIEGMKKRAGAGGPASLLSEEAFQARKNAMGDVTVESKNEVTLPDGRKQIETVYTFANLSNVKFWTIPTLSYKNTMKHEKSGHSPNYHGDMKLEFIPEYERFGKLYKETVKIKASTAHQMPYQPRSSPAVQQMYRRALPIFQDMLKDFSISIVAIAPLESFEEPRKMLENVMAEGNRVTVFQMDGRSVIQSPDMIHQLIMNEVVGPEMGKHERSMPGVFTRWPGAYGGYAFRFQKPIVLGLKSAPAPEEEEEKPKKPKKPKKLKEPKEPKEEEE